MEVFAVADETADTVARVTVNEVIAKYGCPLDLHLDQGRNFQSKLFTSVCHMLGIWKTRTTARNPKCNGQTECFNRTLTAMIRAYIKEQDDRHLNLGCLAGAYRSAIH